MSIQPATPTLPPAGATIGEAAEVDWRDRPTITVREAGRILGLGDRQSYAAVERGEIPVLRIGRRYLVPTARLRKLLGELDD